MTGRPRRTAGPLLALAALLLTAGVSGGQAPAPGGKKAVPADKQGWKKLFDGKSLTGWKATPFGGEGEVHVEGGALVLEQGNDMTGVTYAKKDFPKTDYEVVVEAKKIKGNDFFCTTTFPVGEDFCSLVVGGWGGGVVGLSSLDTRDASENETSSFREFKPDQWYRVRIRVAGDRIRAWIDDKEVVDVSTRGRKVSVRAECEPCKPFGIATWRTVGAVRDVRVRPLTAEEKKAERERK